MNLKTLISTTALAISANTFAVDLASKNTDSYQHIRNATGRLNYAGKTSLTAPLPRQAAATLLLKILYCQMQVLHFALPYQVSAYQIMHNLSLDCPEQT